MPAQLKQRNPNRAKQANPRKLDHGLVCRESEGGCGRPIVIVETATSRPAFGAFIKNKTPLTLGAVHIGEEGDMPIYKSSYVVALTKRRQLEEKCKGMAERGER